MILSDRICCFFGGNIVTMSFVPSETIIETVILGLLGGFVAMLSKDIYKWLKSRLKR